MSDYVNKKEGESVERLISRFRQRILKKGILKQTRERRFHRKDLTKKEQKLKAIYREKKRAENQKFDLEI